MKSSVMGCEELSGSHEELLRCTELDIPSRLGLL